MPQVRNQIRGGGAGTGGILSYPLDQLYREVAFVAYHFHWSHEEIMRLEHAERRQWVAEISAINQQMNEE